jgi:uncharacterized protein YjbI with pentapeptide repeats
MFGRHSATVVPTIQNPCPHFHTRIEGNHRLCLKLTLSALIPLMIGVFTIVTTLLQQKLSNQQREQDKHDSHLLREQSQRLADNLQKESVLVNYLNDVSNILMSENHTKILIHIRTKTLTSLRQLDADRKRYLLLYLYESDLLYQDPDRQNPLGLKISGADFNGIQFIGTIYNKCSFIRMNLFDVYLSNTSFNDCYIDRSNFSYAKMSNAKFFNGILIRVTFKFSLLDNTCFCHMKLSIMYFAGATLVGANFTGSNWENATVDFINANLTGAILSDVQLTNSTLENAILPNKTWGPIQTKNLVINGDLDQQNVSRKLVISIV